MIDTSDIREMTAEDFSKAKKNPYAEKIKNSGYSITIHYSAEDVAKMTRRSLETIQGMDMLELDPDEQRALKKYMEANRA